MRRCDVRCSVWAVLVSWNSVFLGSGLLLRLCWLLWAVRGSRSSFFLGSGLLLLLRCSVWAARGSRSSSFLGSGLLLLNTWSDWTFCGKFVGLARCCILSGVLTSGRSGLGLGRWWLMLLSPPLRTLARSLAGCWSSDGRPCDATLEMLNSIDTESSSWLFLYVLNLTEFLIYIPIIIFVYTRST